MKKLIILTIISLFAYIAKAQTFDYQVKGWQLQVDTSYNEGDLPEDIGTRYWDENDLTTSLVLTNGVVLQDGHELFFDVLNQTGGTLTNGKVVAFAGSVGASGKIKAEYGIADYSIMQPKYIIGIVTHDILNGDQGKVTWFGKVRGIQTNGANYSETWVDGDILYVSPDSYGALTKVQPQAPYPAIPVAAVIKAHATIGTLLVRPTFPVRMQDLADVNGTPLTTKGQIPVWNQDNEYFDFDYNIWPDLISDEDYGSSWNGVDSVAPSKNAVYDKIQSMEAVSYCPATMTVNRGTLVSGTAADLCDIGGTDVQITELSGSDPLRVTFTFSGVTKISTFVFYGDYNGGAAHIVWAEIYNYNTSAWDYLGEFMTSPTKAWYSFPIYNSLAYISSGAVQVRLNHQGTGVSSHNLYLDYLDVNFGGGGTAGATNLSYTASPTDGKVNSDTGTDATIPLVDGTNAGLISPSQNTNITTAYNDRLKWDGGSTGLVAATGRTSLGGTTIGQSMFTLANPSAVRFPRFNADNTVSALSASDFKTAIGVLDYVFGVSINSGAPSTVYDGNVLNFNGGTNVTLSQSGNDITINSTGGGTMVYPGAGIPVSTGSAWGTSITDNSANWNTAYSNRIATFTTTGNSGAATFSGNTLNIPNYTLAGLGGITTAPTDQVHYRTASGWKAATLSSTLYTNYMTIHYTADEYLQIDKATTSAIGLMSAADKTSLDGLVTDKGKVKVQGESTYGFLSNGYFYTAAGVTYPIVSSTIDDGETAPVETNAVYDGLALKANLSGAAFTGAISSTSTMTATDFILSSDRRLKTKIRPLKSTSWVRNIPLVSYQFKSDSTETTRYGVIAQDVQTVNKHLVHKDKNGNLSVSYIDLLIAKIADLEKRVSDLETQVKVKK